MNHPDTITTTHDTRGRCAISRGTREAHEEPTIYINRTRLFLDAESFPRIRGQFGDSEQCEGCGRDICEAGFLNSLKTWVLCECGESYPIEYRIARGW